MSTKLSTGHVPAIYEFIKANKDRFSIRVMCRLLGVAPSGYYAWLLHPVSNRAREDARLLRLIQASFTCQPRRLRRPSGLPRPSRVRAGETCSKHRVARLMRVNHVRALHGYRIRRWSVGKPSALIPNLLQRQFTVTRPNTTWVTDITFIRTWQGYSTWRSSWISSRARSSAGPRVPRSAANSCWTPCSWRCGDDDRVAR